MVWALKSLDLDVKEASEKKNMEKVPEKKKNSGKNATKHTNHIVSTLLRRVEFSVGRNGPDLYLNAMENLV